MKIWKVVEINDFSMKILFKDFLYLLLILGLISIFLTLPMMVAIEFTFYEWYNFYYYLDVLREVSANSESDVHIGFFDVPVIHFVVNEVTLFIALFFGFLRSYYHRGHSFVQFGALVLLELSLQLAGFVLFAFSAIEFFYALSCRALPALFALLFILKKTKN